MAVPGYVIGLGDFAPPHYKFSGVRSSTLLLNATPSNLQDICDRYLNGPLKRGDGAKFVPGGSGRVLLSCSTFPVVEAPNAAATLGYSAYTEVTLLFSVFDHLHKKWSWYAPVLYLDGPPANVEEWQAELPIAVGREMYGLPKTRGEIDLDTTFHTGTMDHVDPIGLKMGLSDSIVISLGVCATPTIDDEIAVQETELLDLVIAEHGAVLNGAPARRLRALRRKIKNSKDRIAKSRRVRQRLTADRNASMLELIRLRETDPRERELYTPKELIDMFWGGDPWRAVGVPGPTDQNEWLASLGFIMRKRRGIGARRRKKKRRRELMLTTGPVETEALDEDTFDDEPVGDFELQFWLLGLRQLHDPDPSKFGQAAIQQVVRTELRFDQPPYKPNQFYCVDIKDSPMAQALGIGPTKQTILPLNNFAYGGATAWFGKAATLVL